MRHAMMRKVPPNLQDEIEAATGMDPKGDTSGRTPPGIHGETRNPPMQPRAQMGGGGEQLGKGAHGFRVHKK